MSEEDGELLEPTTGASASVGGVVPDDAAGTDRTTLGVHFTRRGAGTDACPQRMRACHTGWLCVCVCEVYVWFVRAAGEAVGTWLDILLRGLRAAEQGVEVFVLQAFGVCGQLAECGHTLFHQSVRLLPKLVVTRHCTPAASRKRPKHMHATAAQHSRTATGTTASHRHIPSPCRVFERHYNNAITRYLGR
jgi:hypothetical protein